MAQKSFHGMRRGLPLTHAKNVEKGLDIEGHLLVLKQLADETANPTNAHSIILQHVLPTTIEYIDRVNSVYPVDLVIAICYSAEPGAVEILRSRYDVYVPKSIDEMLNELWKRVAEKVKSVSYPVVVQEVGGYFAEWTHELAAFPNFKGCVEDTANGLWRYQAAAAKKPLAVPIISMADTPLKHVEDALIGDACVYSLEKVMRSQMASILEGVRCGVIGWGHIGKSAAAALAGRHAIVSIYDINPVVDMLAYAQGCYPMPLAQMLSEVDIVMGCSGRRSIRVADLDDLKNGIILCSGASKNIEFDLDGFASLCDIENVGVNTQARCPIQKYTARKTGKYFYILDHGTPMDFLDMPLQGAILDCTCSELYVCIRELVSKKHEPGIISLTDELQQVVAKKWLHTHSEVFSAEGASKDKVFSFPQSWFWT